MATQTKQFATRELSMRTFPDFEHFFGQVHGCACTLYLFGKHITPLASTAKERAKALGAPDRSQKHFPHKDWMRAQELAAVKELVRKGQAHGILVYDDGEPVGWCHFGRADEVPITRDDSIPKGMFARHPSTQWRITCLLTRMDRRRQGVASAALAAAVAAIKKGGGGWIEATTMAFSHRDPEVAKLRSKVGWRSPEMTDYIRDNWPSKEIPGIGRVNACPVTTRTMDHAGTLSMYQKLGFKPTRIDEFRGGNPVYPWHFVVVRLKV